MRSSGNEDVQLLGQVNVHRGAGIHQMTMGQGRRDDGAVVLLLANSQHDPLPRRLLSHSHEQLVVGVHLPWAEDQDRQTSGFQHRAGSSAGIGCRRWCVSILRQTKLKQDQVGPSLLSRLGPGRRVVHHVAPGLHQERRPIIRPPICDFDGYARRVGNLSLEVQERQRGFPANGDGVTASAALVGRGSQRHL